MSSNWSTEGRRRPGCVLWQTLLGGVLSLMVAIGIGRFAYTPALPVRRGTFGPIAAAAGTLASNNYPGYLVWAILAAFVLVGRARRRLLRASLLLIAATTAAMVLTTVSPAWPTLRFLSGLVGAGIFVFASAALALVGLLMAAVGLFGATSTGSGKEYVYGNEH